MKHITKMDAYEMRSSLASLYPQVIPVSDINPRAKIPRDDGIYVFIKCKPPHHIYIGSSHNIKNRALSHRRLRATYDNVIIFRLSGDIDKKILEEIEIRILRIACKRWKWALWSNERDLKVLGEDRYGCPGNVDLMAIVEKILTEFESYLIGVKYFDTSPIKNLPVTHKIGTPSSEAYATGSFKDRGVFILRGSRLPICIKFVSDLKKINTPTAILALQYYRRGLLTYKKRAKRRVEGLYFTQDTFFTNKAIAASVIALGKRPRTDWKSI